METKSRSLSGYLERQSTDMLKQLLYSHLKDEDLVYYAPVVRDILKILRKRDAPSPPPSEQLQKELDRLYQKFLRDAGAYE